MDERERELRSLAERCAARSDVRDAWLAKSFTDLLLVIQMPDGEPVPAYLVAELEAEGIVGYNELHDVSAADPATAGALADGDRYRFVDRRSRGTRQSYVVE